MELLVFGRLGNLSLNPKSTKIHLTVVSLEANNETLFVLDNEGNIHLSDIGGDFINLVQIPFR